MNPVTIQFRTKDDDLLEATFLPEKGMNMVSFKKNEVEVIDQTTQKAFDNDFSGLGPLIGPHYQKRNPRIISEIDNEDLFPHIETLKREGIEDPFNHGVARYATWNAEVMDAEVKAVLTGKDELNGVPLEVLEGQDFKMTFDATLNESGLNITMSVVSDSDSLVGLDYHYALKNGKGTVTADVSDTYEDEGESKSIPSNWDYTQQHIHYNLSKGADYSFRPFLNHLSGNILLKTEDYNLRTIYNCVNDENSWHLFHPPGGSYVCITPISAKHPHKPQLTVSFLKVKLTILDPDK